MNQGMYDNAIASYLGDPQKLAMWPEAMKAVIWKLAQLEGKLEQHAERATATKDVIERQRQQDILREAKIKDIRRQIVEKANEMQGLVQLATEINGGYRFDQWGRDPQPKTDRMRDRDPGDETPENDYNHGVYRRVEKFDRLMRKLDEEDKNRD